MKRWLGAMLEILHQNTERRVWWKAPLSFRTLYFQPVHFWAHKAASCTKFVTISTRAFSTALNKGHLTEPMLLLGNQLHCEIIITWICFFTFCIYVRIFDFIESFNDENKAALMALLWLATLEGLQWYYVHWNNKIFSSTYELALSTIWVCQGRPTETLLIKVHFQYLLCGRAADGAEWILNELLRMMLF